MELGNFFYSVGLVGAFMVNRKAPSPGAPKICLVQKLLKDDAFTVFQWCCLAIGVLKCFLVVVCVVFPLFCLNVFI